MHATATTALYTLSLHDALPIWPRDSRVSVRVDGGLNRPPLEDSEANRKLFAEALAAGQRLGQELSGAVVGGGSDGNFTSAIGIPTLDGLGGIGAGPHARHEHISSEPTLERVRLLAALLAELPD